MLNASDYFLVGHVVVSDDAAKVAINVDITGNEHLHLLWAPVGANETSQFSLVTNRAYYALVWSSDSSALFYNELLPGVSGQGGLM